MIIWYAIALSMSTRVAMRPPVVAPSGNLTPGAYVVYNHGQMTISGSEADMSIAAGEFKARCLRIMDEVKQTHRSVVITKRGKPVAKIVPVDDTPVPLFGFLKGRARIEGDLVAPTGEAWNADA
jgi:prevent-host-death family protein